MTGSSSSSSSSSTSSPAAAASSPPPPPPAANANAKSKSRSADVPSSGKRARARVRCGECEACTRDDCGVCSRCLKKKKFGGDGSCKGACIRRQCKNLRDRMSPKQVQPSASEQKGTSPCATRKSSSVRHYSYNDDCASDDDDDDDEDSDDDSTEKRSRAKILRMTPLDQLGNSTSDDGNFAPVLVRGRTSTSGAHRWSRRKPDPSDNLALDQDEEEVFEEDENIVAESTSGLGSVDLCAKPDKVHSNTSGRANSGARVKSTIDSEKPRSRRSRPAKQRRSKNGIPPKSYLYGRAIPNQTDNICAGCLGRRSEELEHEPIIFCDACDREFHLDCCEPPLEEVPAGTHFCLDCSPDGTTACLEKYFETHHKERAEHDSSRAFVIHKLNELLEGSDFIPQSELVRASKYHHDAVSCSSRFIQLKSPSQNVAKSSKSGKVELVTPDFFLGKCVRLYCPIDNQYHSGRIIDWRKATHSDCFWDSEVADIEYFVRFTAGIDFRKKQYEQWIVFEEHSLAVASTLIWGMNLQRKGVLSFNPGQTWLRTSIEVLPMQDYLDTQLWQIYRVGDIVKSEHTSWALASFYGEETHQLVDLKDESFDFFSAAFAEARHRRNLVSNDVDSQLYLCLGLARVEMEEQQRVRTWHKMKLKNAFHPKALMLRDEGSLEPCLLRDRDPRLCKSIRVDFDQTYLLHATLREPTKDVADLLVCELVTPSPALMQLV